MSDNSLSQEWQELIAGYVLGNLSSEEAEEMKHLLATHPEIAEEVRQLQEVLAAMPYSLPEVTPPETVRTAILAAATPPVSRRSRRRGATLLRVAGTVAAGLTLVLGLDNYRLRQQLALNQGQVAERADLVALLQKPDTLLVSLRGTERLATASGSVILTSARSEAVLVLQNLPLLENGKVYQLWAIVEGQKVASGHFNGTPEGNVCVKLPLAVGRRLSGLAVTIEQSPAAQRPTGPIVMTTSVR
jgi:anti-sigma-K factor RskA